MSWYKTKSNHTLLEYNDLSDKEFRAWHIAMALTTQLEHIPTRDQLLNYIHYKTLDSLQDKLKKHSTDLQYILNKVLIDVQYIVNTRERWKKNTQQYREKHHKVIDDVMVTSSDKIRLDKISNNNTPPISPPRGEGDVVHKKVKGGFTKPSIDDVRLYCRVRKNGIDPEEFCAFYESKGWMIGKNPMKSWQSAIITWEKQKKREGGNGRSGRYTERGSGIPEISTPKLWEGDSIPSLSAEERKANIERARSITRLLGKSTMGEGDEQR